LGSPATIRRSQARVSTIREAIQAYMRTNGAPRGQPHTCTASCALAALDALGIDEHLDEFDTAPTTPQLSEYEALYVKADGLGTCTSRHDATAIVEAVARVPAC